MYNVYFARFYGRKVGSLGVFDDYLTSVPGNNELDATLRLYDRFEHISNLKLRLTHVNDGDCPDHEEIGTRKLT